MKRSPDSARKTGGQRREKAKAGNNPGEYRVGPGRPPREFQFKPGQSGNPKGAKRKPVSIAATLKDQLERALNGKVTLRQGTKEKMVTLAEAGIEQLVNQFAKGDRYARRDLIMLTEKLGVKLAAGQADAILDALAGEVSRNDRSLLRDYVARHRDENDVRDLVEKGAEEPKESE